VPVALEPKGWVRTPLVAFSSDGATLTLIERARVRVLGLPSLEMIEEHPLTNVTRVAGGLSADGSRLAAGVLAPKGGVSSVALLDLPSGKELHRWAVDRSSEDGGESPHLIRAAAIAPDRSRAAFAFEPPPGIVNGLSVPKPGVVRILEASTGRDLGRLEGHTLWAGALAFSPDGNRLASGGGDHTIRIWDVATGRTIRVLKGHDSGVRKLSWSPDGGTLVSAGYDNRLMVWEAETGVVLRTSRAPSLLAAALAFRPDGRSYLSGMSDGALLLWSVPGRDDK